MAATNTAMNTNGAPSPRTGMAVLWTGTRTLVWGGFANSGFANDGALYDPLADSWAPMSTVGAPSGRTAFAAVWTGSAMIVWGGSTAIGETNDGAIYDLAADTWTPIATADAPLPRSGHTAVWTGNTMIIWGGSYNSGLPRYWPAGGIYNPVVNAWDQVSSNNPAPRGASATRLFRQART
jgi:hypothetical protein